MTDPIWIITADHAQAEAVAQQRGLTPDQWSYLRSVDQLPNTPVRVIVTPELADRPDHGPLSMTLVVLQLRGLLRYV